ncbi:MAG TPA: threonine--tRNA ligase [Candidatus Woesearchaeota archaeon]|nr:threonine--tRNA ligase [Candidatus Woesearchaeota archaeon]
MKAIYKGKVKEIRLNQSLKAKDIAEEIKISPLAVLINGKPSGLTTELSDSDEAEFIDFDHEAGKSIFWHSSSHVLALAVKRLYPEVKFAIGPSIENGFYYDFDNISLSDQDLGRIEQEVRKIVKEKLAFSRLLLSPDEAKRVFAGQPYKLEILKEIPDNEVSLYSLGEFTDICRGPHIPGSSFIGAFKLMKLAGAYWKGDSSKKMLTRVYGISFPEKKQLKEYLHFLEEARKKDHKKIGKEMDLFSMQDEGPGFPFMHPKGMAMVNELLDFWRKEHTKAGYKEISTPIILNKALWVQSGHWDHYKENMYFTKIEGQDYAVKPMNCPGGILFYKTRAHSYKEFPLRIGEIGLVHRHELSGVLNGLFRVRMFYQDDAHIFMTPEQIEGEVAEVIRMVDRFYKVFGFEYQVELSTTPEDFMGDKKDWDHAIDSLKNALESEKIVYSIDEGAGAFYGPKIDFKIKDSLGRLWQCATIQLDFQMPQRFDLKYMGPDGTFDHRPIMIHRVIYGAVERFLGVLIEHFGGKFPLWIAPEQARVFAVSSDYISYAKKVYDMLFSKGFRAELDIREESVSKKIREAQVAKVNYILVVGENEQKNSTVNVRDSKTNKVLGEVPLQEFISKMQKEIESKAL